MTKSPNKLHRHRCNQEICIFHALRRSDDTYGCIQTTDKPVN